MKVAEFLLRTLEANGVRHIFGNPGTTEIPLVRASERRRTLEYVVALSEVAAVPMADAYARAARALGVVNLHVAPGLGNGMGNLYTAGIAGTPLLALVGGQDRRFLHTHPILWGPLDRMASTVCKAVFSLNTRHDAAHTVQRALRTVLTPPYAPVALVCPPDLREEEMELPAACGALHPTRAIHALLEHFGSALWLDESGLSTSDVRQWMKLPAGDYFINGSGGIGWGLAAAVGAAIARPERQVVAVIGDGSALYASEALWTGAHSGTRVLLVILSNRRYATLNEAARRLAGGELASFTLEPPVIAFSGLAALYGWRYARASSEADLQAFLAATPQRIECNTLLELELDPELKPVTASRHF